MRKKTAAGNIVPGGVFERSCIRLAAEHASDPVTRRCVTPATGRENPQRKRNNGTNKTHQAMHWRPPLVDEMLRRRYGLQAVCHARLPGVGHGPTDRGGNPEPSSSAPLRRYCLTELLPRSSPIKLSAVLRGNSFAESAPPPPAAPHAEDENRLPTSPPGCGVSVVWTTAARASVPHPLDAVAN